RNIKNKTLWSFLLITRLVRTAVDSKAATLRPFSGWGFMGCEFHQGMPYVPSSLRHHVQVIRSWLKTINDFTDRLCTQLQYSPPAAMHRKRHDESDTRSFAKNPSTDRPNLVQLQYRLGI